MVTTSRRAAMAEQVRMFRATRKACSLFVDCACKDRASVLDLYRSNAPRQVWSLRCTLCGTECCAVKAHNMKVNVRIEDILRSLHDDLDRRHTVLQPHELPWWKRPLIPFAWRYVGTVGVNHYYQNVLTGARKASNFSAGGYSPYDFGWLSGERESLFSRGERHGIPPPVKK